MTTNARDERWSEWVPVSGPDDMPTDENMVGQWKGSDGFVSGETELFDVEYRSTSRTVVAYRYKIKEPESDMHPDLEWLARNVNEWPEAGVDRSTLFARRWENRASQDDKPTHIGRWGGDDEWFTESQWLQARKDLGLIMSDSEEELPAEEWGGKIGGPRKAEAFLNQAAELLAERGKQYDQPGGERSMGKAVTALNAITGRDLTEAEGWLLMSLVKRVRQFSGAGYHKDSAEDAVAYAGLEAEALEGSNNGV